MPHQTRKARSKRTARMLGALCLLPLLGGCFAAAAVAIPALTAIGAATQDKRANSATPAPAPATTALATPAMARDDYAYFGADIGYLDPENHDVINAGFDDGTRIMEEDGWDLGAYIGYDWGPVRTELEVAHKRFDAEGVNAGTLGAPLFDIVPPFDSGLYALAGKSDPEDKRRIIGKLRKSTIRSRYPNVDPRAVTTPSGAASKSPSRNACWIWNCRSMTMML